LKNQENQQELSRSEQETARTIIFILVHPSSRTTSSPLLHNKYFHYKRSNWSVYNNSNTCKPQEHTAPRSKLYSEPTTDHRTI